jgi:ATP-binding cassette, subfamily B, bacterial PglK
MGYFRKFFYVFSGHQRQLWLLLTVFLFTSVLEAFGIGLIGPFLNLASNPDSIQESRTLSGIYNWLGFQEHTQFVIFFGFTIIVFFVIKSVFYFLGKIYTFKTLFDQRAAVQKRLFGIYLLAPYDFHLSRNSADFLNKIATESSKFTYTAALPLIELISNAIIVAILIGLMASTDGLLFLISLITLLPAFLIFILLNKRMKEWGRHASIAREHTLKVIGNGLGGLKETRVIGCESYFQQGLHQYVQQESDMETLFQSAQYVPRTSIETLLVVAIVGFICFSQLFLGRDFEAAVSIMGVFAIASLRLVPAASQLVSCLGNVRNSSYSLDILYLDMKEIESRGLASFKAAIPTSNSSSAALMQSAMPFNHTLELKDVVYRYPGATVTSLSGISMHIKRGESIGLIGQSGAGKTTLVDVVLGLLNPESGDITVDGQSIYDDISAWKQLVGYIPQSIFLMDDTVERNIAFGVPDSLIDSKRLWQAIKAAQLESLIQDLPDGIHTSVGERGVRLSGGQRQRIGIARALYHQREILVLDEATSALDNETERLISESIASLAGSKTLITIAHRLSTLQYCDRIYVLDKGRVIRSGGYEEVVLTQKS